MATRINDDFRAHGPCRRFSSPTASPPPSRDQQSPRACSGRGYLRHSPATTTRCTMRTPN